MLSVEITADYEADWLFDRAVTLLGPTKPDFKVGSAAIPLWADVNTCTQTAADKIHVEYETEIGTYSDWKITNGTQGLQPATPVVAPQTGSVS